MKNASRVVSLPCTSPRTPRYNVGGIKRSEILVGVTENFSVDRKISIGRIANIVSGGAGGWRTSTEDTNIFRDVTERFLS